MQNSFSNKFLPSTILCFSLMAFPAHSQNYGHTVKQEVINEAYDIGKYSRSKINDVGTSAKNAGRAVINNQDMQKIGSGLATGNIPKAVLKSVEPTEMGNAEHFPDN